MRVGSEPKQIVIIVNDSTNNADTLIIWDVVTNSEIDFFDAPDDEYEVLWDRLGNMYLITEDRVMFSKQRCAIKCFDKVDFEALKS